MEHAISKVFKRFGSSYKEKHSLNYDQIRVYNNITTCRTESLGTRIYQCEECGHKIFTYNSCKDRHCPNCQDYKKEVWIEKHKNEILDITYFHVVMTVPAELHPIFYHNSKKMYNLLFKATSETILELCEDEKYLGVKVGITSMLHTWGQTGQYHPHIHMIVTGGGLDNLGNWKDCKNDYLLPVKVISRLFRGKLLSMIKEEELVFYNEYEYLNDKEELNKYLKPLYEKEWVCYSKEPFNNVGETYEYLGRYAFKVCMSNERILSITDKDVIFKYRDRHDNNKEKTMQVTGEEFIRRFLLHALPKGFMKIRHYGLLAGKNKKERIKELQIKTKTKRRKEKQIEKISILNRITGKDVTKCSKCNGMLYLVSEIYPKKPPNTGYKYRELKNA